jgi:hypothetical protein
MGSGRRSIARVLAALVVGTWAGLFLATAPARAGAPSLPPAAAALVAGPDGTVPDALGGLPLVTAFAEDWGFRFLFALDPKAPEGRNLVEFVLVRRDDGAPALARTPTWNVQYRGPTEGPGPAAAARPLADAFVAAVQRNDAGAPPAAAPAGAASPGTSPDAPPEPSAPAPPPPPGAGALDLAMAWLGLVLAAAFLLAFPATAARLARDVRRAAGPWAWAVLALVAAGLLARLLVPHRPVMYYMGYRMAEAAWSLDEIPKYGPGALALYHLLFQATGPSHLSMIALNAVLGGLLPGAAAALAARLGGGRWAVLSAAALVAATPVFVRDSATESLLVPNLLWTVLGLALLLRYRASRAPGDLALAALHGLLAAFSRPESVGLVPLAAAVLWWSAADGRSPGRAPPPLRLSGRWKGTALEGLLRFAHARVAWGVAAAVAVLLALRVAHLALAVRAELHLGNTPVLADPAGLLALVPDLWRRNLALRPAWFPAGVTAVALLPLLLGPRRGRALALLSLALAWLAVSLLDLPHVSLPRVQVPGLFFLALSAAFGLDAAWARRGSGRRGRMVRLGLGALATAAVAVSIPFSGAAFAERTLADDEESLWRDVRAALPDGPVVLVRRGFDDQPVERLHLHAPDYWFRPPFRDDLVIGPDRLAVTDTAGRPVYFVLSTRCWLRECGQQGMHPACRRLLDAGGWVPVFERTLARPDIELDREVRPDQDLDFPWCVATSTMRVGLYRAASSRSSMISASSPSR